MWQWRGAPGDWAYPMSLDGHIFRTEDVLPLIQAERFDNPNLLETRLAKHPIDKPLMTCLDEHVVVNIPLNRVQNVYHNRCGDDWTAERLNELFLAGKAIDTRHFDGMQNRSAHDLVEPHFVDAPQATESIDRPS